MSKYTITSFILSLILISLVVTGFGLFMADMNTNYERSDSETLEIQSIQKLDELSEMSSGLQDETELNVESGITDIIGGYFKNAYQSLRTSLASISLFTSMTNEMGEKSGIKHINLIMTALISSVLVIIFIGIFISAMVKKDV